jgi:hypothetical protein
VFRVVNSFELARYKFCFKRVERHNHRKQLEGKMEFLNVEGKNYELWSIPEDGVFSSITANFNSAQRPTVKLQPPDFASMHLHATKETSSDPYTQIHAYAPSNSQSPVINHCKGASLMTICSLCPEPA